MDLSGYNDLQIRNIALAGIDAGLTEAYFRELGDDDLREVLLDKLKRPGDYWVPNGAQWNFIKAVGGYRDFEIDENTWVDYPTTYNFVNAFVAANGGGKTDVGAMIAAVLLGGVDNPFFYDKSGLMYPFYRHPPAGGRGRIH